MEKPVPHSAPSAYLHPQDEIVAATVADGFRAVRHQEGFVRNASQAQVAAALAAECLDPDVLNIVFNPTLLRLGGELVLIDTGLGAAAPPTAGKLLQNLAALGVEPSQVSVVVISHFHGDHIGGLRDAAGRPVFANARVLVPEPEWDFWMSDEHMAAAPDATKPAFQAVRKAFADDFGRRLGRYRWGETVVPGLTAIDAHGHTPGHTSFLAEQGGSQLMILSDVTNHPALFVRNPDWAAGFDMDPDGARASRRRILGMAADGNIRVVGFHFPFPSTGRIVRDGERFRFMPAQWLP